MINLKIDSLDIETKSRIAIIEACQLLGIKIPRFCYHELLSISGNCRMCLIEIDTIEKPIASCATEAKNGMEIFIENPFVKKARENSLELLLINHP
ncbi:MAG: 2Fe-2S iron-sulfur cluster-binding protein, partial [Methanobacterium sp.]